MSRFENSYLAESVGYSSGMSHGFQRGLAAGRECGETAGWNDAINHCNITISSLNDDVEDRDRIIAKCRAENKQMMSVVLEAQEAMRKQHGLIGESETQKEGIYKAFLGLVAIATPIVEILPGLSIEKKDRIVGQIGILSVRFQSQKYIDANSYPHTQKFIRGHMPNVHQIICNISNEVARNDAKIKAAAQLAN